MQFVRLGDIERMLDDCAPGHAVIPKTHSYFIKFGDKEAFALPKGKGGASNKRSARARVNIPLKKVLGLATHLELEEECVQRHFPAIKYPQA